MTTEKPCSTHPEAPHGFVRNASYNAGHYVCECSGWTPPASLQEELRSVPERSRTTLEAADRIDALEAEVVALTKDAERYQWLRHGDNDETVIQHYSDGDSYLPRNKQLDAAIDAAMKESK